MKLTHFGFEQDKFRESRWVIQQFDLYSVNLIVGRNATGKSRLIAVIQCLADLISGRRRQLPLSGYYVAQFHDDDGTHIEYRLNYEEGKVIGECLSDLANKKLLLTRDAEGKGRIWFEKQGEFLDFQSPTSQVVIASRQDPTQHPFFEPLIAWANRTYFYAFGSALGREAINIFLDSNNPLDLRDPNHVTALYQFFSNKHGDQFKTAVREDLAEIGYNLDEIGTRSPRSIMLPNLPNARVLYVKETELASATEQIEISQGMFRALALLILINIGLFEKMIDCLLIDDIGEGLDFERATALIKRLVNKADIANFQLLLSTNDRFVMNSVPLENWLVLKRDRGQVAVFSQKSHPRIFEEFKFTGLNNFDFFATDYIGTQKMDEQ